ncbi:NAD(P)-dependent dehydrogenase, short-chain alcohol dehydrogenase family [Saccharopolyspora antimicrobica]|uniref:NAD(P)-dependent dehydrogenase (Short-subunit alcohol dehydrogenase family) n=1 Tax=Saccharopolyspora antimicrobica TaxID=455193 RepID=A0A1I5HPL1_9PSEU|nr:oxidoreductase [Saccharopolyspora antimicrobica]RKT82395.1 NAD(P)-dependent dehydrogenase (short-subunit alcohol dehydrogenase family) [Saccharopolyspora antimicrobica]SFO50255.1 NAD(P)-dependent dehydrogenase, short-chain alcohol dehydrogenase family [Saccharopolyspora antimicrobica]
MTRRSPSRTWSFHSIPDQSGRLAVVTGANSGIGYVTARELARRGAHVVLGCRNPVRGQAALERLRTELPDARIELHQVDLASLRSVAEFAESFEHRRIDLLINNAGVAMVPFARTADGFESQFGINHLGTFALTSQLLPRLLTAPAPRVVTVSSEGQRFARFDLTNLNAERGYQAAFAYVQSKRANLYFARELHRRAARTFPHLRSIAVAPGLTRSNVLTGGSNAERGALYRTVMPLLVRAAFQPTAGGARTSLYAATGNVPGGSYIAPSGFLELRGGPAVHDRHRALHDAETACRLWQMSEELTGVRYPVGSRTRE